MLAISLLQADLTEIHEMIKTSRLRDTQHHFQNNVFHLEASFVPAPHFFLLSVV